MNMWKVTITNFSLKTVTESKIVSIIFLLVVNLV